MKYVGLFVYAAVFIRVGSLVDGLDTCGRTRIAMTRIPRPATKVGRQPRVIGGLDAMTDEFPWLVSIGHNGNHLCGGAIITSRHILTAAHCFDEVIDPMSFRSEYARNAMSNKVTVKLGTTVLYSPTENSAHHHCDPSNCTEYHASDDEVDQVFFPPEYNKDNGAYLHDIAIIQLKNPVTWTGSIQPLCLPDKMYNWKDTTTAFVAGWGGVWPERRKRSVPADNKLSQIVANELNEAIIVTPGPDPVSHKILQKLQLQIKTQYECRKEYLDIENTQMCAGVLDDTMNKPQPGDSGSPLMVYENNAWTAVGIVSSIDKDISIRTTLFTRISAYKDWILQHTRTSIS